MTQPQSSRSKDQTVIEGDPFGVIKEEQSRRGLGPREINEAHNNSDKDSSQSAQHHTLGTGRNQAAAGSHVHGGTDSKKIGSGLNLTVAGNAAGNTALNQLILMLKNVIEFNDTHTP